MIANTPKSSIFLSSGEGTLQIDIPEMTKRLNAADPTIVDGPSSPGGDPRLLTVSMTLSMISGAEDPSAMRLKFAIVGFQIVISPYLSTPS